MRRPSMTTATTTAATNRNPPNVMPRCPRVGAAYERAAHWGGCTRSSAGCIEGPPRCAPFTVPAPLAYAGADALEREAADVVPVEPDEERPTANMIIRHEAPVAAVVAVVAVVAHHEVVALGHPA